MSEHIDLEARYCAQNYHPLPVVLTRAEGAFVWDEAGKKYLDMMSAYSAVSHGHGHKRLVKLVQQQVERLSIVSRAFYTDKLGLFLEKACTLTGQDMALPMITGAEAVETAIKAARKWAYTVKGVEKEKAEIIACTGNFHGRTTTIVAMSGEPQYKEGFGPYPAGFLLVEYGNIDALDAAINENTAAFLVEPIQGEGGIVVPPEGYLKAAAELCRKNNVLLIDGLILGKALGGGILPVSMFLARRDVMGVFTPGDHGSTFGGNPLAAAVGLEALNIIIEDELAQKSAAMGDYLMGRLRAFDTPLIKDIRGRGLFIGIEVDPALCSAREICESLMQRGLLSKETHETVVRLAPPLIIGQEEIDWAVDQIAEVLGEIDKLRLAS